MTYQKNPKTDDLIYIFSFPKEFCQFLNFRNVSYKELDKYFKAKIIAEFKTWKLKEELNKKLPKNSPSSKVVKI